MTWRRAPLYVRSHDLAVWLMAEVERWPVRNTPPGPRVFELAQELVVDLALALTFPDRRAARRRRANEDVVGLRVLLRVAQAAGWLTPRRLRYAAAELDTIGRMIGGWEKSSARVRRGPRTGAGASRPEARGARRQLLELPCELPFRVPQQEPGLPRRPPRRRSPRTGIDPRLREQAPPRG